MAFHVLISQHLPRELCTIIPILERKKQTESFQDTKKCTVPKAPFQLKRQNLNPFNFRAFQDTFTPVLLCLMFL